MNKRRLNALAAWLEAGAPQRNQVKEFNMADGIKRIDEEAHCGTACCIAGAAVMFYATPAEKNNLIARLRLDSTNYDASYPRRAPFYGWEHEEANVFAVALGVLHLSYEQALKLFTPANISPSQWNRITAKRAARVIRGLVATGRVKW